MLRLTLLSASLVVAGLSDIKAADLSQIDNLLRLPHVGDYALRVISPAILEISLITTKEPDPAQPKIWNFVGSNGELKLPATTEFKVTTGGVTVPVEAVGFKRRVLYAPLKKRDLRIANELYLRLGKQISEGGQVIVDAESLAPGPIHFSGEAAPDRWSPAIHVNQTGYAAGYPKRAMVGYYLGSLGEFFAPGLAEFKLLEAASGRAVFSGKLTARPDKGFTFPTYQQVAEADFSAFDIPGEYKISVPGLGVSFPFFIDGGTVGAFVRAYVLGLYHQRCGTSNAMPFTRFTHDACHIAPAEVPTMQFKAVQSFLKEMTDDYKNNPKHTAPRLENVNASLYPFVRQGKIDVSGGHHDAGDYSKYTINSAALIHYLVFAADVFPGAGELDNLGLPESGDGKSDLLQEAKWEADFLAKMQDSDGGFYFLVYPRDRQYEDNVLPEKGDPQIVFPKNTSATAAAVAALAQTGSSPLFRKQFPKESALYLQKARLGWTFLERALAKHGRDGAYQKITHYGNEFQHDDELAWAAAEMFLATGEPRFEKELISHFEPADRETRRWTWWRMYEAYGCAIRDYAVGARNGRVPVERLNAAFLAKCQDEVMAAAEDQARFTAESAYGTAFPDPSKRFRAAGWYFSLDRAFDLAAAAELGSGPAKAAKPRFIDAYLANMNYEGGCNPVNICYVTGLGWKWPREIVHHYAQNDRRILPPTGLPIGNIQEGFQFLHHYQKELGRLSFPLDSAPEAPFPFYDRWGDSFNVNNEFVIVNQGRALAGLAWLMAANPTLRKQPFRPEALALNVARENVTAALPASGGARIVWEMEGNEPMLSATNKSLSIRPGRSAHWVETEAYFPDGRRFFGAASLQP